MSRATRTFFSTPRPQGVTQPLPTCDAYGCSAFSNVSLVMHVNYAVRERVPLLLLYERWFRSVVFLVPEQQCVACRAAAGRRAGCFCTPQAEQSNSSRHFVVEHIADAMLQAASSHESSKKAGVLFAHGDMWINVRRGFGQPLSALWTIEPNPPLRCYDTASREFQQGSPWYHDSKSKCSAAVQSLNERVCCLGWSDLFYLPSRHVRPFRRLAVAMRTHLVHHEVAIPTLIHTLHSRTGTDWRKISCSGSCCTTMRVFGRGYSPHFEGPAVCAHKINLGASLVQDGLKSMLDLEGRRPWPHRHYQRRV